MNIKILKNAEINTEIRDFIHQGLIKHAIEKTQYDGEINHFAIIAEDQHQLMGALLANTFWGALNIRSLYVKTTHQNQGLGSHLLNQAFIQGKNQACTFATLETLSFQALDFYFKKGFKIDFKREGYKLGSSYYYLSMPLNSIK